MSLVSGPGRGVGGTSDQKLYVEKHVDYIKSLDTVRFPDPSSVRQGRWLTNGGSGKMSWSTG